MLIVLIILSAGLLTAIIYFAVSNRSSWLLKQSAIIALGLIALSLAICGIFLIVGPGEEPGYIPLPFPEPEPPPAGNGNTAVIVGFLVVFLLLMTMVIILSRKEQQKREAALKAAKTAPKPAAKPKDPQPDDTLPIDDNEIKIDDSFNIEIESD